MLARQGIRRLIRTTAPHNLHFLCLSVKFLLNLNEFSSLGLILCRIVGRVMFQGAWNLQTQEYERIAALSQREREVLILLAEGLSAREIAARLNIADGTAGVHVTRIYEKLGVNKAVIAVRYAIRAGLIDP
jgi:DNA-binding NarL/FixJ family response regulator